jgi:hypothetical protein
LFNILDLNVFLLLLGEFFEDLRLGMVLERIRREFFTGKIRFSGSDPWGLFGRGIRLEL